MYFSSRLNVTFSVSRISLRCKAMKKFLPYQGFYPVERTVELAKEFFNSPEYQAAHKLLKDIAVRNHQIIEGS